MSTLRVAPAMAGGFYTGDVGTRAIGRGGAFVAAPDSLLAIHYNPAGLSFLRGLHFEGDLSLVSLDFQFLRTCPCLDPTQLSVEELADLKGAGLDDTGLARSFASRPAVNNSGPLAIPFLGVGFGLPFADLTIAAAVWGPNAAAINFGEPTLASGVLQAQRYAAVQVDKLEANIALGAGFQLFEGLRLGAALMIYQTGVEQRLHLWANTVTVEPENTELDVPITVAFRRNLAIDWSLGASYELASNLFVGASFRGKRSIRSEATITAELSEPLRELGAALTGENVEIEFNMPALARFGVQYELPHFFVAEAAVAYEGWSVYRNVRLRNQDVQFEINGSSQMLGSVNQIRNWKDTVSMRIGGEILLLEPLLTVQAGYFYEPGVIPPEQLDTFTVDLDKHGLALGISTDWNGFVLSLAGQYIALVTETVTSSDVRQTAPLTEPRGSPKYVTTVGNGVYSGSFFTMSASLSFAL